MGRLLKVHREVRGVTSQAADTKAMLLVLGKQYLYVFEPHLNLFRV